MVRLLIVGDSISVGYEPVVRRELAALALVQHNPDNGGDSSNVLAHVDGWLAAVRPDLVTLNCGLHDIKRDRRTGAYQVPLDLYRRNLRTIADRIAAAGPRLLWVTTTPVIEQRHRLSRDFDRFNADIDAFNAAAAQVLPTLDVIDLHAAATGLGLETVIAPDGVHFTPAGYESLGQFIAARLRELI